MSSITHQRIPALDGLRGIAVLLVIFHHSMQIIGDHATINNRLFTITESWNIGVDIFFVLSGYLITSILLKQRSSVNYYRAFYWRRCLRIFPLYYATIAILSQLAPLDVSIQHAPWYLFFGSNLFILFYGFGHTIVVPLWSVALEEQYYAIWPIFTRCVKVTAMPYIIVIILLCQPLLRYFMPVHSYTNSLTRLDGLLLGSLVAFIWPRACGFFQRSALATPILIASVSYITARMFIVEMRHTEHNAFFEIYDFQFTSVAFAVILASLLSGRYKALNNLLSSKPLINFGLYSYALYLFHSIVGYELAHNGLVPNVPSGPLNILSSIAWALTIVGITWIIAFLSWRYLEAPILALKDRISYDRTEGLEVRPQTF